MTTPCVGLSWLFDSTSPEAHAEAAALCATCPAIDACRDRLDGILASVGSNGYGRPEGTWAGQLFGGRQRPPCGTERAYQWHRHHEPNTACIECRAAHARYTAERKVAREVAS